MKRWENPLDVRFITFSCERRRPLLADPAVAGVFAAALDAAHRRLKCELFAWVAMPEHVHLLVRPPRGVALDRVLLSVKLAVTSRVLPRWSAAGAAVLREITRPDGRPRFWQKGGGFDRNVRDTQQFAKHVRYIHRNPVTRGLVERAEDWRWSSVRWWMGMRAGELPCDPPPNPSMDWASWRGFV